MMSAAIALPKRSRPFLMGAAAFAVVLVVLFWPTFQWMAERFDAHDSFYSHGWLIPPASAWLIWRMRDRLAALPKQPSWAGLWLLVPSLLLQVAATWWRVGFASGLAMVGAIWGLVWTYWGRRTLWTLRGPLVFLLFMVPVPGVLLIATSFRMKLAAATLATQVLNVTGIPASQAGSTIHVPGISVVVDDVCSGLRSLISLIALSTLWMGLMPADAKGWQRAAVVAASIPIALAANMVRILVLVLLSAIYGPQIAESFIHYGSGVVVFGVALCALAWVSQTVQRWSFVPSRLPSSS